MGGMDIEEVAENHPDAIAKYRIDPAMGYWPFVGRRVAHEAQIPKEATSQFVDILGKLYELFFDVGAKLLEINPLAITKDGRVIASDAKVDIDDNGLFRHQELEAWKTALPQTTRSRNARARPGWHTSTCDGDVGTIANGAGLVDGHDGRGQSRRRRARQLPRRRRRREGRRRARSRYNIVTSDPKVKSLFINIFGGITRGDEVAKGIVEALDGDASRKIPLVIRLTGTNEKEGRRVLQADRHNAGRNDGRRREASRRACAEGRDDVHLSR